MRHNPIHSARFFFTTTPLPCPYLPDREERRVVTELAGRDAGSLHDTLSLAGYRRSHNIAYAPACPDCDACKAVRVVAGEFRQTRSHRRVCKLNAGLKCVEVAALATEEHYALFAAYQSVRHGEGEMAKMDYLDYLALIEDTPVDTFLVEFRDPVLGLVAVCLVDRIRNGLSAVYSFFDPAHAKRSLGTFMILWLLGRAKALGLDHVYLGFFIEDCAKMCYKTGFQPLQGMTPQGWRRVSKEKQQT